MKNSITFACFLAFFAATPICSAQNTYYSNEFSSKTRKVWMDYYSAFLGEGNKMLDAGPLWSLEEFPDGQLMENSYYLIDADMVRLTRKIFVNIKGIAIGESMSWAENGDIQSRGFYKNGKMEGRWTYFHKQDSIASVGSYKDDKRTGEWKYFDEQGRPASTENYGENGKLEGNKFYFDTLGQIADTDVFADGKLVSTTKLVAEGENPARPFVDAMPQYPGGEKALLKFLADNIKYPVVARNHGIQGRVFASFVIEKDGSMSNVKIVRGLCEPMKNEVFRVLALMPKWNPGMQGEKNVRVRMNLPVMFKLD